MALVLKITFSSIALQREPAKQLSHPADRFFSSQLLGAIYTPVSTTFRVFAPTASGLKLRLYQSPIGGHARVVDMKKNDDGTWEATIDEDCLGLYYTYSASGEDPGFNPDRELIDPYARAVTSHNGRAIVVHDTTPIAPRPKFPPEEAIIYELHLRDFTIDPDSGIQRRGK